MLAKKSFVKMKVVRRNHHDIRITHLRQCWAIQSLDIGVDKKLWNFYLIHSSRYLFGSIRTFGTLWILKDLVLKRIITKPSSFFVIMDS